MKQLKFVVLGFAALLLAMFSVSASFADGSGAFRVAQASAGNRIALVIGNATYPDDNKPLAQPIKDARAVAGQLKRAGFEVIIGEDLSRQRLRTALDNFKSKIKPGAAALFFFSGYGIQSGKQSYIIPVDAQIWTEGEVKRDGISVESILADMNGAGAMVKLVIIDAARRNPFERRFRGFSAGLASLNAPAGTLAMYSAAADKVANESDGENSLFVTEFLKEMQSPGLTAEAIFNNTRRGVSRASKNEQVPWVSSSLIEEFSFGKPAATTTPLAVTTPPPVVSPAPTPEPPRPPTFTPAPGPAIAIPAPTPKPAPVTQPSPTPSPVAPVKQPERDRVIQEFDDRIRDNPRDADAYYQRGQAWAQRREFALANEDFGEAIRLNPNDPESLNNRCFTRAVLGQLEAALSDCNEAVRLRPNYADAFDSRGLTNLKLGRFDRAIADYSAAIRINPRMASALYGRGKAKTKKGDSTGGNADIRSAKAIDPGVDADYESFGVP